MKRTKERYEITDEARFELKEDENVSITQFTCCKEELESETQMDKDRDILRWWPRKLKGLAQPF